MEEATEQVAGTPSYVHREGTRQYLEAEVLPHLRAGLTALLHKMQQERLQLAAGTGLDEGRFRQKDWRPFCAAEWLAEYLLQHKPCARDAEADVASPAAAAAAAAQEAAVPTDCAEQ